MQEEYPKFANEENLKKFISYLKGVIDLDKITEQFPNKEGIADYLIENLLVIELKTLKSNPETKVKNFLADEMSKINNEKEYPIFYGKHNLRKVAHVLPNGENIINKLDNLYFRQIEGVMRKANKQIKSTIKNLNMNSYSYGVLIVINEQAEFYQPEVLSGYICRELLKKNEEGNPRYSNIHQVAVIQSSYKVINNEDETLLIPCHFIKNSLLQNTELSQKAEEVMKFFWSEFSRFNGVRNFHIENPLDLPVTELIKR